MYRQLDNLISSWHGLKKEIAEKVWQGRPQPSRVFSGILKGTKKLDDAEKEKIKNILVEHGFDICKYPDLFEYTDPDQNISANINPLLGVTIKTKLEELKMSQLDLASFIGVSKDTISNWLTGKNKISDRYIKPLSDILKISVPELNGLNNNSVYVSPEHTAFLARQTDYENEIIRIIIEYQYTRGYSKSTLLLSEDEMNYLKDKVHLFLKDDIENYINATHPLDKTVEKEIERSFWDDSFDRDHEIYTQMKYWLNLKEQEKSESRKKQYDEEIVKLLRESYKLAKEFNRKDEEIFKIATLNTHHRTEVLQDIEKQKKKGGK